MPRSDMRHPEWESFRARDRRLAAEEVASFLAAQAARRLALAGRRVLPAVTPRPAA